LSLIKELRRRLARKLAPFIGSELAPHIIHEIDARVAAAVDGVDSRASAAMEDMSQQIAGLSQQITDLSNKQASFTYQIYRPNQIVSKSISGEYMRASNAQARDFFHPKFAQFCQSFGWPLFLDRKLWEYAFIYEHLNRAGVLAPGSRGLGFGVGLEALPALFASLGVSITATDAPTAGQWTGQHSESVEQLFNPDVISRELFDRRVRFEPCDMNNISTHLSDYDFCWSSCALEHLGSLQHGCDFVINSVEKTLKIGGVACHTTELNLSSDEHTVEHPDVSLYRKRDLERLCATLADRGHLVEPLRIEPGDLPPDYLVDAPPYTGDPHLKMLFGEYVTTSVGIVVRRGPPNQVAQGRPVYNCKD
jgi:hypothetical protein